MTQSIQLWYAPASSSQPGPMEALCESVLTAAESSAANRFKKPASRNQHVIGRGMARVLLAGKEISPGTIQFGAMPGGKPFVSKPEAVRHPFNIAHTDGLVVCGITNDDLWLGVDVEPLDRRTDLSLANRYFADAEIQQLEKVFDEPSRRHLFMKIWTLKEAFIKAIGTGMRTPLDAFALTDLDRARPTLTFRDPGLSQNRSWQCNSFSPTAGYVAAVVVGTRTACPPIDIEVHAFQCGGTFNDLTK